MEALKNWWTRFSTWVRYEPVRAAETVRAFLFALTGALAIGPGADEIVTQVSAVVTALFSLYASQRTRNRVSPVAKVEDGIKAEAAVETFDDV